MSGAWVEVIDGAHIYHERTNEFTVVTRPATDDEVKAFEASQVVASDEAKARISELEKHVEEVRGMLVESEKSRIAFANENEELKGIVTQLREEIARLSTPATPPAGEGAENNAAGAGAATDNGGQ